MNATRDKQFRDDDGDFERERLFESAAEEVERYVELLGRLGDRLERLGISTFAVVSTTDPLSAYACARRVTRGNYYQNIGAARAQLAQMEAEG